VGAGTVYRADQVDRVKAAGGSLIVMPHCDRDVITAARSAAMDVMPGVATPSEAFQAFASGATLLKVFPADCLGPAAIKAWVSVLPSEVGLIPVGGIQRNNLDVFAAAGAVAFGVGSALYKSDMTVEDVSIRAKAFVRRWRALKAK
jgi:2-dehydro-3-deoxyphosphogalactonate aldolase